MLLPYLDQNPLYNAANFNWACCWDGMYDAINSTVYSTKINSFLCPSDGLSGFGDVVAYIANINNYAGSIGTTTIQYPNDGNSSGIFKLYNPNTNAGLSVTLAEVTDGSSNTIAFGEGLVGDYGKVTYRGNGMSGPPDNAIVETLYDAKLNQTAVTQALQSCNVFWTSGTLTGDTTGLKQYTGQVWAQGDAAGPCSIRSFRPTRGTIPGTVVVWAAVWGAPGRLQLRQRQQQPPGRGELRVSRRQREVHQGLDQHGDLRVAGHPSRRRGCQRRYLLIGDRPITDPPADRVEIARRGRPCQFPAYDSGVPAFRFFEDKPRPRADPTAADAATRTWSIARVAWLCEIGSSVLSAAKAMAPTSS